jgi:hypothetical protein
MTARLRTAPAKPFNPLPRASSTAFSARDLGELCFYNVALLFGRLCFRDAARIPGDLRICHAARLDGFDFCCLSHLGGLRLCGTASLLGSFRF